MFQEEDQRKYELVVNVAHVDQSFGHFDTIQQITKRAYRYSRDNKSFVRRYVILKCPKDNDSTTRHKESIHPKNMD